MRLLAFSDLHRDRAAARLILDASHGVDVVVGAGDFATMGKGASDTLDILQACAVPVVLVHGNHDDPDEISAICAASKTLHYLHGTSMRIAGHQFFGLGGEIPSRSAQSWNASDTEAAATTRLKNCPQGAVLITHSPPFGAADLQKTGAHEGSVAIRDAALRHSAVLLLCGHIHHSWGTTARVGATAVYNLGPGLTRLQLS